MNEGVICEIAGWRGELVNFFDGFGLGVGNFGGFVLTTEPTFSHRLAQFEAGVGVYGRTGVCLNPSLGCFYRVGVLLTEAALTPSDKDRLRGFEPCEGCNLCAEVCPVRAIDASKAPAQGYNRELCVRFITKLRDRYERDARRYTKGVKICSRCFSVCPWARPVDRATSSTISPAD